MAVSYNNLWKLLIDKGMNKIELKEAMSWLVWKRTKQFPLKAICMVLNCNIDDIMDITTKKEQRTFSTIELFADAGGLSHGVKKAGFRTFGFVEVDKDASDTSRRNRPDGVSSTMILLMSPVLICKIISV